MNEFDTVGYKVVHNAISKDAAALLATELQLICDNTTRIKNQQGNPNFHNDGMVENCFSYFAAIGCESLLSLLQPKIEEITGKKLYPCYSYSRIYYNGAVMETHLDRPSCEYSATMTLDIDESPWEIYMENLQGESSAVVLPVGSMLVYQGTKLHHWRTEYKGKRQVQVFIHYVDANGLYPDYKFDKRTMLGAPKV